MIMSRFRVSGALYPSVVDSYRFRVADIFSTVTRVVTVFPLYVSLIDLYPAVRLFQTRLRILCAHRALDGDARLEKLFFFSGSV